MGNKICIFIRKMCTNILKTVTGFGATKMVMIVRTDINMGKGKIASQVAHAAISLYQSALNSSNPHLKSWLFYGQPKIVLKVDDDMTLNNVYELALKNNLNVFKVFDAGKTQVECGTLTVIGIGPNLTKEVDEITKGLKLL